MQWIRTDHDGGVWYLSVRRLASQLQVLAAVGVLLLVGIGSVRAAVVEPLDGIAAVVEDDVILTSELAARVRQFRDSLVNQRISPPPLAVLEERSLDQLILENIQLQLAERQGIRVNDSELAEAMGNVAKANDLSPEAFRIALEKEGVSYAEARERFREEMIRSRLQQRIVDGRVRVTEKEVQDYLRSAVARGETDVEYRIAHILLARKDGVDEDERLELAQKISERLQSGEPFSALAAANSDASTAAAGGDLGWRKAGALPSLFADVVPDLQPGSMSEPIVNASGVHLVYLQERRGESQQLVRQVRARHILIKPTAIRDDEASRAVAEDLYQKLRNGEDFAATALAFSDDPGTASSGGEMDWLSPGETVPVFDEQIMQAAPGTLLAPFRSRFGWHIAEVLEVREQDVSRRMLENNAHQVIYRRKFEEQLQAWLTEVRDEAYVQIRN